MQLIILAAGRGSRMKSNLPKVMHEVHGKPMLTHVMENCRAVTNNIILVYSDILEPYLNLYQNNCTTVIQEKQLGTAHAVSVAKKYFAKNMPIGVIYGDNPLITDDIIRGLFQHHEKENAAVTTLAFEYSKPNEYGKIITDKDGNFLEIIESKFANKEQHAITLCNSGVMAFSPSILEKYLDKCLVPDHIEANKELYLTDIIKICTEHNEKVSYYKVGNHKLVLGINTKEELSKINNN